MPTRTKSWAILSTSRRLPERLGTLPADHLELSPYSLQSRVHCVFKTLTGLDSRPIPTIFFPGYRPEAPGRGGTLMFNSSIQIFDSSLCRHVGLCSLSQKIPTEIFF